MDEGDVGPSVHQSLACLTIQLAVHKEPSGLAKVANQGAWALEWVGSRLLNGARERDLSTGTGQFWAR